MKHRHASFLALTQFIHHHLLWFLIAAYVMSAIWPAAGLGIRNLSFGALHIFNETLHVSLLLLLLATLMFNAGFGSEALPSQIAGTEDKGALGGAHRESHHPHGLHLSGHPDHATVE